MPSKCNRNELGSRARAALGFSIFAHGLILLLILGIWMHGRSISSSGEGLVMVDLADVGGGDPGGASPASAPTPIGESVPKKSAAVPKKNILPDETTQNSASSSKKGQGAGRGEGMGNGGGGSGEGSGTGNGGGGDGSLSRYVREVLTRIERNKQYPRLSQQNGEEGIVLVDLRIGRSGQLLGYDLRKGSSSERLIQATKHSIEAAAPFPPLPEQYSKESLTLQVPVRYQLD